MKKSLATAVIGACAILASAHPIDFDQIRHWTGKGPNRAALVVQYPSDTDPHAYVWGYRWEDGATPTGEDMFKAICANSRELCMLTQYTGQYGATLCGIGLGNVNEILDHVKFDFDMAKDYEWINFDYYNTNSWFGQAEAPGDNSPAIAQAAIDAAKTTHVIQHPFDAHAYGYPAYDYDCWKLSSDCPNGNLWISGWYEGYWSYWLSSENNSEWLYSGTGFTGRKLTDGDIDAWSYTVFETPGVGGFGEGNPPTDELSLISYRPANTTTGVESPEATESGAIEYYNLSGMRMAAPPTSGIYIRKQGNHAKKIIVQ